jgi:lipid II:glycine glycyltransferase (peptidoglycan interpeptide bridge formation enzyme)
MNQQIVNILPTEQWRAFVDGHPKGNIFQTPEMFEVHQQAKGHRPELWAVVEDGQILALFIPVHISLQSGYLRHFTTRSVSFGSVLSIPGRSGDEAVRQLLKGYKKTSGRKSLFTELRNLSPLEGSLAVLREQGFAYEEHLNYLIDLDLPSEAVLHNIGSRTRKNIKKGLNKGIVKIEEVCSESGLREAYRLLDMTYRAAHVPLSDYSLFEAASNLLGPKKMIRFALATVEGEAAAASVELLYRDRVFGWFGGMDRRFASYTPNELLMWSILKWGAENGFKQYDFGGAGKPHEKYGVRDFKAKFGGDLVCYGRNVWVPNPARLSLSTLAYQAVRRVLF